MYLAIATRPDLMYAVSYASRFLESYNVENVNAVKRIFRYLHGTSNECLIKREI